MNGTSLDAGLVVGLSEIVEKKHITKTLMTHTFESELTVECVVKCMIEDVKRTGQIMLTIFVMNAEKNELKASNLWVRLLTYSNHKRLYGGKAFFQKLKTKT